MTAVARQSAFVNRPESALGRDQSNRVLLYLLLACLAAGSTYALLVAALGGRGAPSRGVGVAAAAVVVVALAAGVVAIQPLARFDDFKQLPAQAGSTEDFVQSHLLSANGSGRWQFWESAVDAFREKPVLGHGAGSYEAWWAEHGSLALFIRDAHSLYVEVLAELGLAGFLLLVAALVIGSATALIRLRGASNEEARDLAAPTAAFLAFCTAAAIDWMWELTVVSAVAFACLGLMVRPLRGPVPSAGRLTVRPALVVAGLVAAWFLVCLQALPYLSELQVRASQEAVARGDDTAALDAAQAARAIEPWAASPWLQLALVREELGDLRAAEAAIVRAREKDSSDWRLWLISARLETKLGEIDAARASLRRARDLNPRSPLFRRQGA